MDQRDIAGASQTNVPNAPSVTAEDRELARESVSLSATATYEVVRLEGIEELRRPNRSLWLSGIAAGLCMSFSVVAEAALRLSSSTPSPLIEAAGYTVGFLIVIVGRLQLFTEATISAILPLLSRFSRQHLLGVLRLWTIVFTANMIGAALAAALLVGSQVAEPLQVHAMVEIGAAFAAVSLGDVFLLAIPAGFLIAALVWMLPRARESQVTLIFAITYLIAIAGFAHVVAGAVEIFLAIASGRSEVLPGLARIAAALAGNIVGGTVLFASLAYGQIASELKPVD